MVQYGKLKLKRGRWAALVLDPNKSGTVEPLGKWTWAKDANRFRMSTYKTEQAALKAAAQKADKTGAISFGAATLKKGQSVGVLEL